MYKNLLVVCVLGLLTVVLGAFGAHALAEKLSLEAMRSFETGVRYQMYHVLALLFVNLFNGFTEKQKNVLTKLFLVGVLCFSGSIYAIQIFNVSAKNIWFITPLGGLLLIFGWFLMAVYLFKKKLTVKSE